MGKLELAAHSLSLSGSCFLSVDGQWSSVTFKGRPRGPHSCQRARQEQAWGRKGGCHSKGSNERLSESNTIEHKH
ncbi:hypothetical protein ABG768_006468, partial [Culter alburnus]